MLRHLDLNHAYSNLGDFSPKSETLGILDFFMQLMHEARFKSFHNGLGTRPNHHHAQNFSKKFELKTLVQEIGGFGFLLIL